MLCIERAFLNLTKSNNIRLEKVLFLCYNIICKTFVKNKEDFIYA